LAAGRSHDQSWTVEQRTEAGNIDEGDTSEVDRPNRPGVEHRSQRRGRRDVELAAHGEGAPVHTHYPQIRRPPGGSVSWGSIAEHTTIQSPIQALRITPRGGCLRGMASGSNGTVRLALVDDYEVVLTGLAHMFERYGDRIEIAEIAADEPVTVDVDVALFDTFAQGEVDHDDFAVLLANPHVRRAAVYTWAFDPPLIDTAKRLGAAGYLSKTMTAAALVDAIERIDRGEVVVSDRPAWQSSSKSNWPGRHDGLSEREAEIMALITQGKSNAEIAAITYLSINSIKTHIRNAYRKAGVASRAQAVLWGVDHGLKLEQRAIDRWRI